MVKIKKRLFTEYNKDITKIIKKSISVYSSFEDLFKQFSMDEGTNTFIAKVAKSIKDKDPVQLRYKRDVDKALVEVFKEERLKLSDLGF